MAKDSFEFKPIGIAPMEVSLNFEGFNFIQADNSSFAVKGRDSEGRYFEVKTFFAPNRGWTKESYVDLVNATKSLKKGDVFSLSNVVISPRAIYHESKKDKDGKPVFIRSQNELYSTPSTTFALV